MICIDCPAVATETTGRCADCQDKRDAHYGELYGHGNYEALLADLRAKRGHAGDPFRCVHCGGSFVGVASMRAKGLGTCDSCAARLVERDFGVRVQPPAIEQRQHPNGGA